MMKRLEMMDFRLEQGTLVLLPSKAGDEKRDFAPENFLGVAEFLVPLCVTPHTSRDFEPRVAPPKVVSRTGSDTYVMAGVACDLGQQFALSRVPELS
jgi:hypothetical protein